MRKVLMMFLCLVSIIASATDYYVSSTGDDSANGLSSSTPWRTIAKVNSEFYRLNPGDKILFKRGEVFKGTLIISKSGTSGNPISIDAYGTGAEPVISGFASLNDWTNEGGGIYSKAVSCESKPNVLVLDGSNTAIGRWPNTGWMTIDTHSGSTSITDAELPSSPDWDGAEIIVRTAECLVDRSIVSNHSGQTLTYSELTEDPVNGSGYFIQNHRRTLDIYGEWCYTNGIIYLYFGSEDPENHVVKVSVLNNLVEIDTRNYITFRNLHFEGANENGIFFLESDFITVQNCIVENGGQYGIHGSWGSDNAVIEDNKVTNNNNIGIDFQENACRNTKISNNHVAYSGYLLGMGLSGYDSYCGITNRGENSITNYNIIEYSGYCGLKFGGQNADISYNFINYSCLCKDDGAGIYSFRDYNTNKVLKYNIVLNSTARPDGWYYFEDLRSHGIYLDGTYNTLVTHNTLAGNDGCGIFMNAGRGVTSEFNTCYDNVWGIRVLSEPDIGLARNHNINNNILFAKEYIVPPSSQWKQSAFGYVTMLDESDIGLFGTSDNNYFARPVNDDNYIDVWYNAWDGPRNAYNLSEWQSKYGKDSNSHSSPVTVSDVNKIRFEYNASNSNKVVSLDGSYIDVKGAKYSGTITLPPYTSVVLIVDPNPSAPPASPVYVGSAIENSTPSVIEITYNLSLANIVPPISAFAVQVNSVARSVNSVSVSGTKVLLTLSSPVAYGNVVTVSYAVPSSNPLQTPAGGKAVALSAKSVTNRVSPPAVPVFTGAAIENAAPSVIEMTYNLSLANIVPAASAFLVAVNSVARTVKSVTISGTKVKLTLASPVVYGNIVTVAYTKPSANPIQTPSGGQAATLSTQTVTNRVNAVTTAPVVTNTAPVVVVNYSTSTYSGFVGTINATGSYDANKDNLTYTWKIPGNIPVSATNSPIVDFLAPIVDVNQRFEFSLSVSDGKAVTTRTVPVTIIPYKPDLETAEIISVEAADFQSPYLPYNIIDGNIGTIWSALGNDQWIILELKESFNIQHVKLAFQPGQKKQFYFDILGSNDKQNWEPILIESKSCAFSGDLQVFDFPESKAEKEFRYVKLVGQGNSTDKWNYIAEIRIFGYRHKNPSDYEEQIVKIYPNPAHELVNILIDEQTFVPDFIKIVSLTGKILYSNNVEPDIRLFQVPINFRQGVYLVQMGTGNITMFTQKLIVSN